MIKPWSKSVQLAPRLFLSIPVFPPQTLVSLLIPLPQIVCRKELPLALFPLLKSRYRKDFGSCISESKPTLLATIRCHKPQKTGRLVVEGEPLSFCIYLSSAGAAAPCVEKWNLCISLFFYDIISHPVEKAPARSYPSAQRPGPRGVPSFPTGRLRSSFPPR